MKYKANMTREGSANIVNFIFIGAEGLMLGHGCIIHYSEYILTSTLSIYITFNAFVLSEYNAAFLMPLLIYIYSIMSQLIGKYEPF